MTAFESESSKAVDQRLVVPAGIKSLSNGCIRTRGLTRSAHSERLMWAKPTAVKHQSPSLDLRRVSAGRS
jgi:hypothetical protein